MTSALETEAIDLKRKYTEEERDALFDAYADACGTGDHEKAMQILQHMPLHPRWAKIIADVVGKDFLVENFNITHADEVYGEGWLNG